MNSKTYHVYILASQRNGTLYTGITSDLHRRMAQHRTKQGSKFVTKYKVLKLVYAEAFSDPNEAIAQEKRVKKWQRKWKLEMIEKSNPNWDDITALVS
jgi:putative endonuclease